MQAVMAFAKRKAATSAASGGMGGAGEAAGAAGPWSGKQLGGASRGMSILGSISEWAAARQKAGAMDQEARDERMAGRQEFIQASQKVNAIDAEYNSLVGNQLAAASAMGIDVGSGSVVAAREQAWSEAERERRIIRSSADLNAAMRRLRAANLNASAKASRFGATVKLGLDLGALAMGG